MSSSVELRRLASKQKNWERQSHLRVLGIETDSAGRQRGRTGVTRPNLSSKATALAPPPRRVDVSTQQLVCRRVEQRERLYPRHCARSVVVYLGCGKWCSCGVARRKFRFGPCETVAPWDCDLPPRKYKRQKLNRPKKEESL